MFAFGSWTKSKEGLPDSVDWVTQPAAIAVAGIFVLVAVAGVAYSWKRRPESTWQPLALGADRARVHARARGRLVDDDGEGGILTPLHALQIFYPSTGNSSTNGE